MLGTITEEGPLQSVQHGALAPAAARQAAAGPSTGQLTSPGNVEAVGSPPTYTAWRQLVAVVSGKGGVGKSNVAAGLSILLSASGARVALVDADIGLGNLDVLLGVSGGPTLAEVAAGWKSMEEILLPLPCGVHLAAGGSGPQAPSLVWRSVMLEGLARIRRVFDVVLLDCGSGIGPEVMDFCALADHVLVVTTPEPTALTDAYGLIKSLALHGNRARVSVLVNMAASREEARATQVRLAAVAGRFLGRVVYDGGYVLADRKVPQAVRRRRPFVLEYPGSPASRCLKALAAKLRPGGSLPFEPNGGLVKRIVSRLSLDRNGHKAQ